MTTAPPASRCLNCGAALTGRFCAICGQRAVPPNPTVGELAGDAWEELSGYDGRIAATFRDLLRPGMLTRAYLEGRRARYLTPVRLYLTISVAYFLLAAAAPQLESDRPGTMTGPGIRIEMTGVEPGDPAERRQQMMEEAARSPWVIRPIMRAVAEDPVGFRTRIFTTLPRVFFAMLPAFAACVALLFRGRTFPTSLVFAVHLHAFTFLLLTLVEAVKFTGSRPLAITVALVVWVVIATYVLKAFKDVFQARWWTTVWKAGTIAVLYTLVSMPAFLIGLIWAAL